VKNAVTAVVIVLACVAGLWLASVDARTDDAGIEAGLIFLIAAALAAARPRAAIVIAFIVGAPIPIAEALQSSTFPAGIVALGFSVAGALVGAYIGILARRNVSSTSA
jgi:bifunctional DNase/RNase